MSKKAEKISLSEHTLNIREGNFDPSKFDFSEVEDFVRELTGEREYQFQAIKKLLVYLWGGKYESIDQLAKKNYKKKEAIQQRFESEKLFLANIPLSGKLSGVCHMATGTGKSYVMYAVAYLSILLGKTKNVFVIGPPSTIIEEGLNEKFKEYINGEMGKKLLKKLPAKYRGVSVTIQNANDTIQENSILVENINAIWNKDRTSVGDFLKDYKEELLVLSDEVHHAYTHLSFNNSQNKLELGGSNTSKDKERLWMKFLRETKSITRHIGFTGTPYNANDYFSDVIFNYSIKDAIDENFIKKINPIIRTVIDENETLTYSQRLQTIIENHVQNKVRFNYNGKVKPITIFINKDQSSAEKNANEFIKALCDYHFTIKKDWSHLSTLDRENLAREKVICVISNNKSKETKLSLENIEEIDLKKPGGLVEFIFAVNKLSEGWDVDNVFQIVPMQDKVFNSKLLISQVLGRGMRLPRKVSKENILSNYPEVLITNHEKFAPEIGELLNQVIECESRIYSAILEKNQSRYSNNFVLFNVKYDPINRIVDKKEENNQLPFTRTLQLTPFRKTLPYSVIYNSGHKDYELKKNFYTVDQVVSEISQRFKNRDFENKNFDFGEGMVLKDIPNDNQIKKIITKAKDKVKIEGNKLSEQNRSEISLFFNVYLPQGEKKVVRENVEGDIYPILTSEMLGSTVRVGALDEDEAVFISEDYDEEIGERNGFVFEQIEAQIKKGKLNQRQLSIGGNYQGYNHNHIRKLFGETKNVFVVNSMIFKTPQDLVIVSHKPEINFVFKLIEAFDFIDSWIKSRDMDFYSLEYEFFKGGKDRVRKAFNPDFFIKIDIKRYLETLTKTGAPQGAIANLREKQKAGIDTLIHVVEIKSDGDKDTMTLAKDKFGASHFKTMNQRLLKIDSKDLPKGFNLSKNQYYVFNLLRPNAFNAWFGDLKNGVIR